MPHFCIDELYALMLALPFVGYFVARGRHYWHRIFHRKQLRAGRQISDGCCKHEPRHHD